jgi:hypothetical protein
MTLVNHNQVIFDAIVAATSYDADGIIVNVKKFIETFNSHRDRALCTSLRVGDAQAPDDPDVDLRLLVDIVWQHATESTAVPFHKTSDMLIAKYRQCLRQENDNVFPGFRGNNDGG